MKRVVTALLITLALTGCTGGEGLSEGEEFVRQPIAPSDGPSGQVCLPEGSLGGSGATPSIAYNCATTPPSAAVPLPTATD